MKNILYIKKKKEIEVHKIGDPRRSHFFRIGKVGSGYSIYKKKDFITILEMSYCKYKF